MSYLSIGLKIASCFATIGGISAGGYFIFKDNFQNLENKKHYVIAVQKTSGSENSDSDFKCQITGNTQEAASECNVKVLTFAKNHKNQVKSGDLKSPSLWVKPSAADWKSNNNYFKIEINADLYTSLNSNDSKTLDVFSKDKKTKITTLNTLFSLGTSDVVPTKTKYAVGKVTKFLKSDGAESNYSGSGPITIGTDDVKCDFTGTSSAHVDCEIYKFTQDTTHSSLESITFLYKTDKQSEITKNNFYLFKLTASGSETVPANFLSSTPVKATVKTSQPTSPSSATDIVTLEISELHPLFLSEEVSSTPAFLHSGSATRIA